MLPAANGEAVCQQLVDFHFAMAEKAANGGQSISEYSASLPHTPHSLSTSLRKCFRIQSIIIRNTGKLYYSGDQWNGKSVQLLLPQLALDMHTGIMQCMHTSLQVLKPIHHWLH